MDDPAKNEWYDHLFADIKDGNLERVERKVKQEIYDPDYKDGDDRTVFHVASEHSRAKILEVLGEKGGNVNVRDYWARLPFHYASNRETRSVLIKLGAPNDIDAPYDGGDSDMKYAAEKGDIELAKKVLGRSKTAANYTDMDLRTPLHFASKANHKNHPTIVEMLIKAGADVRAKDKDNNTPLFYAGQEDTTLGREVYSLLWRRFQETRPKRETGCFIN